MLLSGVSKALYCPDLTIVTWNNKSEKCVLERSLDRLGLRCVTLGKGVKNWSNVIKTPLVCDFLQTVTTKYVLGMDGFDCVVVGDPGRAIRLLQDCGLPMMFNATNLAYCGTRALTKCCQEKYAPHVFCQLNAGVWLGEVEFCKRFFDAVNAVTMEQVDTLIAQEGVPERVHQEFRHSEQLRVKLVYAKMMDSVFLDCCCEAFQILNDTPACLAMADLVKLHL
jgi:hypothetical protein